MYWVGGDKHNADAQYVPPDRNLNLTRGVLDSALVQLVKDMPMGTPYLTRYIDEGTVMAMQLDPAAWATLKPPNVPEGLFVTPIFSTSALFVATTIYDKGLSIGMLHLPIIIGMDDVLSSFVGGYNKGGPDNLMLVTSGGRAEGSSQPALANSVLGSRLHCATPTPKNMQQWIEARAKDLEIAVFETYDQNVTMENIGSIRFIMFLATTANGTVESLTVASYAPRSSQTTIQVEYKSANGDPAQIPGKGPLTRGWSYTEMSCGNAASGAWNCMLKLKLALSTSANTTSITSTINFKSKSAICFGSTTAYRHSNGAGFDNPDFVYAVIPVNQTAGQPQTRVKCANPKGKSSVPGGMHMSSWLNGWAVSLLKFDGDEPIKVSTIAYRVQLWELLTSLAVTILLLVAVWHGWDPASEMCLRHIYSMSVPGTCLEDRPPLERTMYLALLELPTNLQVGPYTHHVMLCPQPGKLARGLPQSDSAMDLELLGDETMEKKYSRGKVIVAATTYPKMCEEVKKRGLEGRVGGLEL
ncbi:hypothetical protein GGF32_005826 [Allomyces javanicus]|nr:hypothetical protein GGF32_005826 [Allomyces javanicus]